MLKDNTLLVIIYTIALYSICHHTTNPYSFSSGKIKPKLMIYLVFRGTYNCVDGKALSICCYHV